VSKAPERDHTTHWPMVTALTGTMEKLITL